MKSKTALTQLKKSFEMMKKLDREVADLTRAAFPIGTEVSFAHGDRLRFADVVDHNEWQPRLKVKGPTGREYWIDVYRVLEEVEVEG